MNIRTLFAALVIISLLSSCGKTYQIAFQVPEGMNLRYETENTSISETKVMGMDVENVTINNMTYRMEHVGSEPGGLERFKMSYEDIQYEQSAMGQEMIYDSKDPSRSNNPQFDNIYGALLESEFELLYNSKGGLEDAPGLSEVMDKMFADLPAEAQETVRTQMGDNALLQAMKSMTYYYPQQEKVKIGDSWDVTNEIAIAGMELIIDSKYTLMEVKDGQAKIQVTSEIDSNPDAAGMDMMGFRMSFDLQGTQEGFIYVDESTSWLNRMELDQQLDGFMNMSSEQTGDMKVDMKVQTQQLIQKVD